MQIRMSRDALTRAVSQVWHIADRRSTMRILSCVLVRSAKTGSVIKLASSNIRNTVQYDLSAEADGEFGFAVPAKTLSDVVRILPDAEVTFTRADDDKVLISSGTYSARVPCLPQDEFPALPESEKVEKKKRNSLSSSQVRRLIDKTSFSISDDETRPYLNGALFERTSERVRMVTTDGHRMTICSEAVEGKGGDLKLLIPQLGIAELRKFLELGDDPFVLAVDGSSMHFTKELGSAKAKETMVLTVRLTDSEFPPYESVIPKSNDKSIVCPRARLQDAIRRVSVMTSERHRAIHMKLVGSELNLSADNPELGEAEENLEVEYGGENLVIGFNAAYLGHILSAMDSEKVELRFGGGLDGAIFKVPDSDEFLGIVMPIRI